MRENTTTGKMEFYDGSLWQEINDTASTYSSVLIPSANFNTVTYTGAGVSGQSITSGLTADVVWIKKLNSGTSSDHQLFDTVRGPATNLSILYPNDSYAEDPGGVDYLANITSTGFTVGSSTYTGGSGNDYVSWNWKAGGAAVTNNVGSISSQVSANTAAGFSIATWSGDGSASNIGHGLGGIPQLWIIKNLAGTNSWVVGMPEVLGLGYLQLESNAAASASDIWGTIADSTKYYFNTAAGGNGYLSTGNYVGYFWRSIPGYSKIGFYVGNGSTTGPEIYTGFKPAWLLRKNVTNSTDAHWSILDNKRNITTPMNPRFLRLLANLDNGENTSDLNHKCDFNSTGFQPLSNHNVTNALGETYIYMAFSE